MCASITRLWLGDDVPAWFFFPLTPFHDCLRHLFEPLSGAAEYCVERVYTVEAPFTRCDTREQFHGFFHPVHGVDGKVSRLDGFHHLAAEREMLRIAGGNDPGFRS